MSTYPCPPLPGLENQLEIPVAYSRMAGSGSTSAPQTGSSSLVKRLVKRFRGVFLAGRYLFGPLSVRRAGPAYRRLVTELQPDLVHAMRIPYEGMLAGHTPAGVPLVVSIWGNDLTLHAAGSARFVPIPLRGMAALTRRTLERADGLLADAARDIRLARGWGLAPTAPTLVIPGSGGLDLAALRAGRGPVDDLLGEDRAVRPLIVNPRGLRPGSLRTDVFFKSLPEVIREHPNVLVACPSMQGEHEPERWVATLGLTHHVRLLPGLPQPRLWDLLAAAQILVSPGAHDGTPNSFLEGIALGCFPIAGDIESLREWITPGLNGLLYPPGSPQALSASLCLALADPARRLEAARLNLDLVTRRAEVGWVMDQVEAFYQAILHPSPS